MVQLRTSEVLDAEEFLSQYGVLGMKWGVRKDERAARKLAKREERAKKFDARAAANQKNIDAAKKRMAGENWLQKMYSRDEIKDNERERKHNLADAKRVRDGKLTRGQKTALITTGVATGAILAGVTAHHIQSGEFNRLAQRGAAWLKGQKFEFKKNDLLKQADLGVSDIEKLVVDKINPDYGKIGTKMNCRRATFAYELRRRGLDVAATKTTTASGQNPLGLFNATNPGVEKKSGLFGSMQEIIKETIKDHQNPGVKSPLMEMIERKDSAIGQFKGGNNFVDIFKELAKQPNRSRGEVSVMWKQGGGHSMAYEIVDGIAHIFDTQTHTTYTLDAAAEKVIALNGKDSWLPALKEGGFTRLDNIDLNLDYLMKWVKNAV